MTAARRVLRLQPGARTSAKGDTYLGGWLGEASVVAFQAEEPDVRGNPVWDVFVSTPEPRAEAGQERPQARPERRPQSPDPGDGRVSTTASAAKPSAPPSARGDGWRGSSYRRPANGAQRAPAAGHEPFYDDDLADVGRAGR